MCNANNFISSVQTSRIRIRITGYSFRKALETEKKKYAEIIFTSGEEGNIRFFCVWIIRFRQFGAKMFLKVVRIIWNEKKLKKNHFFSFNLGSGSAWRFLPGSGSAKKCGSESLVFSRFTTLLKIHNISRTLSHWG